MKLGELKQHIEEKYPKGIDQLGYPAVEELRLQGLVDLLNRGNPDYAANINSIDIAPFAYNSYYQPDDPNVRLGLTRIPPGQSQGVPSSAADIVETLIHEITHSLVPTDPQKMLDSDLMDASVHRKLLSQPGGLSIPALNQMFNPNYNASPQEIPSNVLGWAIPRYLFPGEQEQPHAMFPEGYRGAANEVVRIMQLSDYARKLAEEGLP